MEDSGSKKSSKFRAPSIRGLRACVVCCFVQTQTDFENKGCPNCDKGTAVNKHKTIDRITPNFDG